MVDVFISYSRKDKPFVRRLHEALAAQNRDTWVDWEDIPPTADWWREICAGIESADSFLFVISPDSVRSEVCRRELEHALANNKRFVPLLRQPVLDPTDQGTMHPSISTHNWLYFQEEDDFEAAFKSLITSLDTDLSHVRQHTRLLVRGKEWEAGGKDTSFLLRGDELKHAEEWLAQGVNKKPAPSQLHAQYITASRRAAVARQRTLLAGVSVALVVSVGLAILSLLLFGESNIQRDLAVNNAMTATIAQGEAEVQAVIAENNAATATIAQGEAELQAILAENNAATATYAQGEAELQAMIAQNNAATATFALGEAEAQRIIAERQATAVAQERDRAQSIALSGQSQVEIGGPRPDRAAILALFAIQNYRYTWQAERALALAVRDQLTQVTLTGHADDVTSADWSPDSQRIVTASNDGTARIWNLNGQVLYVLGGHNGAVTRAIWSPDGTMIATSSSDGVRLWNAANGQLRLTMTAHRNRVQNLAWSPDGSQLASASIDQTARIWDTTTGEQMLVLTGHEELLNSVVWSSDGSQLLTASDDHTARIWDAVTGEQTAILRGHQSDVLRAVWSPDGSRILTASLDNTARVWDSATGAEIFTLSGHISPVRRALWSPDGVLIATVSDDDTARVWDSETGELLRTLFGHTDDVTGLVWSLGGSRLITVGQDSTARIWYTESGGQLLNFTGHTDVVYSATWSPDGTRFVTASADGTARIWQVWRNAQALIVLARGCCAGRILTDEESLQFGIPIEPSAPPPDEIAGCPTALVSRLYVGARGVVTTEDASAVNVRRQPGTSSSRIGQVAPGQTFRVIDGPECAEDIAWFRIIYGINAVQGWIAEGQSSVYFVAPEEN